MENNTNSAASTPPATAAKKTQGRRKIEIKKIENVNHRHVAFSKRRVGLFNKASELCILCGTEVAAIVESYGGKRVFTFGHPSADAVINRYLSSSAAAAEDDLQPLPSWDEHRYRQAWVEQQAEKVKSAEHDGGGDGHDSVTSNWWDLPIEGMDPSELQNFVIALEELKKKATLRVDELEEEAATAPPLAALPPPPPPPPPLTHTNFACSPPSSSDPITTSALTMLTNYNERNDDVNNMFVDDCYASMFSPTYDDNSYYMGYEHIE